MTGAAVVAAGAVTAAADAQVQRRTQQIDRNALRQVQMAEPVAINPNARAIMPGGDLIDRGEILTRLGLNPNTPADAWLNIVACGINASALKTNQISVLERAGELRNVEDLQMPERGRRQRN